MAKTTGTKTSPYLLNTSATADFPLKGGAVSNLGLGIPVTSNPLYPPPLSKVRPGEKKVRSERGVCLQHGRALDKGGITPPCPCHPIVVSTFPMSMTPFLSWHCHVLTFCINNQALSLTPPVDDAFWQFLTPPTIDDAFALSVTRGGVSQKKLTDILK